MSDDRFIGKITTIANIDINDEKKISRKKEILDAMLASNAQMTQRTCSNGFSIVFAIIALWVSLFLFWRLCQTYHGDCTLNKSGFILIAHASQRNKFY